VTADCLAGNHATGGGGFGGNNLDGSYPSTDATGTPATAASTNPRFWTATFASGNMSNTAYAICVPN